MPSSVLVLPGLLEDADAFEHQLPVLREIAPCKVADLTRADTIAGLAEQALEQAPEGPLALAGHSMGGYVALEMVRRWPERVERLALLNTHARPDSPEATENRRRLMALAERDFPGVIQALTPKLLASSHQQDLGITGTMSEMALGIGKEAFLRQERAIIGRIDSRPHLPQVRCPALVIAAREDQIMPLEWLQELARGIPGARLEVLDGSGHMSTLERPEEVARLLRGWLET
ncbi:MAG TPA: alpha/beta hydrolase [Usitatibacter sp.]|jgi:pimeloyl-ACP methyl ester carboxylesterase|nr:alpha/beta hydrolase [Usitatibacter sp.]